MKDLLQCSDFASDSVTCNRSLTRPALLRKAPCALPKARQGMTNLADVRGENVEKTREAQAAQQIKASHALQGCLALHRRDVSNTVE